MLIVSVTQQWKNLQIGNFPPYVSYIYWQNVQVLLLLMKQASNIPCRLQIYSCRHTLVQFQSVVEIACSVLKCLIQKMVLLIYTGFTKEVINSIDTV